MTDQQVLRRYLIAMRRRARNALREMASVCEINRRARRLARKHRASGNPMLIRAAEQIDANVAQRQLLCRVWFEDLRTIGRDLMTFADHINAHLSAWELMDILNTNRADRAAVSATDGLVEIAYVKGLEDSAMHRSSDTKEGPLAQAMMYAISHSLATNEELQAKAHEHLFGKGGMFEFLPTYRRRPDGEFVKNPPKLRLADECDLKGAA